MWALARDRDPRRRHLGGLESPYRSNSSRDLTRFNAWMHPAVARKSEETAETTPQRSEKPHDEHDAGCIRRSRGKARRRRRRPRSDQKNRTTSMTPDASGGREKKRGDGGDAPAAIRKTARRARRRMLPAVARKSEETAEPSPQRSKKNRAVLLDGPENRADRI